jgi:hypothetical protein
MAATTRTAIKPAAKRHTILRRPEFFIFSIYPDQSAAAKYKSKAHGPADCNWNSAGGSSCQAVICTGRC